MDLRLCRSALAGTFNLADERRGRLGNETAEFATSVNIRVTGRKVAVTRSEPPWRGVVRRYRRRYSYSGPPRARSSGSCIRSRRAPSPRRRGGRISAAGFTGRLSSNGRSPLRKGAPNWRAPIRTARKSQNHCDGVLVKTNFSLTTPRQSQRRS